MSDRKPKKAQKGLTFPRRSAVGTAHGTAETHDSAEESNWGSMSGAKRPRKGSLVRKPKRKRSKTVEKQRPPAEKDIQKITEDDTGADYSFHRARTVDPSLLRTSNITEHTYDPSDIIDTLEEEEEGGMWDDIFTDEDPDPSDPSAPSAPRTKRSSSVGPRKSPLVQREGTFIHQVLQPRAGDIRVTEGKIDIDLRRFRRESVELTVGSELEHDFNIKLAQPMSDKTMDDKDILQKELVVKMESYKNLNPTMQMMLAEWWFSSRRNKSLMASGMSSEPDFPFGQMHFYESRYDIDIQYPRIIAGGSGRFIYSTILRLLIAGLVNFTRHGYDFTNHIQLLWTVENIHWIRANCTVVQHLLWHIIVEDHQLHLFPIVYSLLQVTYGELYGRHFNELMFEDCDFMFSWNMMFWKLGPWQRMIENILSAVLRNTRSIEQWYDMSKTYTFGDEIPEQDNDLHQKYLHWWIHFFAVLCQFKPFQTAEYIKLLERKGRAEAVEMVNIELNGKIERLQNENYMLHELASNPSDSDLKKRFDKQQDEIASLNEHLKNEQESVATLTQKNANLTRKVGEFEAYVTECKDRDTQREKALEEERLENARLKKQIRQQAKKSSLSPKEVKAVGKVGILKEKVSALERTVNVHQEQHKKALDKLEHEYKEQLSLNSEQNKTLMSKIATLTNTNEELVKRNGELSTLVESCRNTMAALKMEHAKALRESEDATVLKIEAAEKRALLAEQRVDVLEGELQRARKDFEKEKEKSRDTIAELTKNCDVRVDMLIKKLESSDKEVQRLTEKEKMNELSTASLRGRIESAERERVEAERMKAEIEAAIAKQDRLIISINDEILKKNNALEEINIEKERVSAEISRVRGELQRKQDDLGVAKGQLETTKRKIASHKRKIDRLMEESAKLQMKIVQNEKKIVDLTMERDQKLEVIRKDIVVKQEELATLRKTYDALESHLQKREEEIKDMKAVLVVKERAIDSNNKEIARLTTELGNAKRNAERLEQVKASLELKVGDLENQISRKEIELLDAVAATRAVETKLNLETETLHSTRTLLTIKENEVNDIKAELAQLSSDVQHKEELLASSTKLLADKDTMSREELEKHTTRFNDTQSRLLTAIKEKVEIAKELSEAKKALDAATKETENVRVKMEKELASIGKVVVIKERLTGEKDHLEREIKGLRNVLYQKEEELLKVRQRIAELEDLVNTKGATDESTAELASLHAKEVDLVGSIETVKSRIQEWLEHLHKNAAEIERLTQIIHDKNLMSNDLESQLLVRQKLLDDEKRNVSKMEASLKEKTDAVVAAEELYQKSKREVTEVTEKLADALNSVFEATQAKEKVEINLEQARVELQQVQNDLSEAQRLQEEKIREYTELQKKERELISNIHVLNDKINSLKVDLAAENKQLEIVTARIAELENIISRSVDEQQELDDLHKEKGSLEERIRIIKTKTNELMQKLEDMKEENARITQQLRTTQKELGSVNERVKSIQSEEGVRHGLVTTLSKELDEKREDVARLTRELREKDEEITKLPLLEFSLEQQKSVLEQKEKEKDEKERDVDRLKNEVNMHTRNIQQLRGQLDEENGKVKEVSSQLVEITSKHEQASIDLQRITDQLNDARDVITKHPLEIQKLKHDNGILQNDIADLKEQIASKEALLEKFRTDEFEPLQRQLEEKEMGLKNLQEREVMIQNLYNSQVEDLERENKKFKDRISQNGVTVQKYKQMLKSLQEKENDLNALIKALKEENALLDQRHTELIIENEKLLEKEEEYTKEIESLNDFKTQTISEKRDLTVQLQSVTSRIDDSRHTVVDGEKLLSHREGIIEDMMKDVSLMKTQLSDERKQFELDKKKSSKVHGSCCSAQRQLIQEKEELTKEVNRLKATNAKLKRKIEKLKSALSMSPSLQPYRPRTMTASTVGELKEIIKSSPDQKAVDEARTTLAQNISDSQKRQWLKK